MVPGKGRTVRNALNPVKVVDLHLKSGYNGRDALLRQIETFRGELDSAIRRGEREIIFVHGVGSGKLRQELVNALSLYYPSLTFHNAPFSKFGYEGAMLISLKK